MNEALRQLELTRLIVAHRPETYASADRVIELVDTQPVQRPGRLEGRPRAWASTDSGATVRSATASNSSALAEGPIPSGPTPARISHAAVGGARED